MKTSAKYALGGVGLALCCFLVITNLGTLRSPSYGSFIARKDASFRGGNSHGERDAESDVSRRHGNKDRSSESFSVAARKESRQKSRTPKRTKYPTEDTDDPPELPHDQKNSGESESSQPNEHTDNSADLEFDPDLEGPVSSQRKEDQDSAAELKHDQDKPEPAASQKSQDGSSSSSELQFSADSGGQVSSQRKSVVSPEVNGPRQTGTGQAGSSSGKDGKIKVGELPEWWKEAWKRTATHDVRGQFVGDRPLFARCQGSQSAGSTLYDFVEPPGEFLPPVVSKNPCWYQLPRSKKGLRCAPYLYLVGVAKCGTSDLSKRLKKHPEVFPGTQKEYHWWERFRFGMYDEDNPDETVNIHGGQSFRDYLQKITGNELADLQKELRDNGSSVRIFGDYSPSYMWDPHNWYALEGNQGCHEPRMIVGQHIRHFWPPAKIMMIFRHPTPRLYSRFMSRIHRTPELKKATVKDFHNYVDESIKLYMACFRNSSTSIRQCVYNVNLYRDAKVRLVEGMYPVFMEDWLRVWPRDQIFIMRYEDYGGHERERMQEIIKFLGLSPLNKADMDKMMAIDIVNAGTEEYQKYGSMLPETKKLLDDFYQPFVDQFAQIVNEERFLWKDVYQ